MPGIRTKRGGIISFRFENHNQQPLRGQVEERQPSSLKGDVKKVTMEDIIFNLIVMLYDQSEGYTGINDPAFKEYVCSEAGIQPVVYDQIMEDAE